MGVGYVPQGRGLFPNLTVKENLYLGYKKEGSPDLSEYIFERFQRLKERLNQQAGTLSGGEQQMLSIARILLIHPKIILLDEPTEGIMPILVSEIRKEIKRINGAGIEILLVEQNVQKAFRLWIKKALFLKQKRMTYEVILKFFMNIWECMFSGLLITKGNFK